MHISLTHASENSKTGPLPVSVSSQETCPTACPLRNAGCYANYGPLLWHWRRVTSQARGTDYDAFLKAIQGLPRGQLWRHNAAGDLCTQDNLRIDTEALAALTEANKNKRGFTYTHYSPGIEENAAAIRAANQGGFTINLSANNLAHADWLADFQIAPVVTILPVKDAGVKAQRTPAGRKVLTCPTYYQPEMTCAKCGICQNTSPQRAIIGFPAHGTAKHKAELLSINAGVPACA